MKSPCLCHIPILMVLGHQGLYGSSPSPSASCPLWVPSERRPRGGMKLRPFTNSYLQEPPHRQFSVLGKMNWEWTVWTLFRFSFDYIEEHKAKNAWEDWYNALLKCLNLCRPFKGLHCSPKLLQPSSNYYRECCLYQYLNMPFPQMNNNRLI